MAEVATSSTNDKIVGSDKTVKEMDADLNERHTGAAEALEKVVKSRKRKSEKMDTDEEVKRPNFPPISADKLTV